MQETVNRLKHLTRHPFTKDVAVLQTASVFAKAVTVATSLVFARVLGPDQYGFYGLVFALAGFINIFQDLGIGQASINLLARARSKDDARESRQIWKFFTIASVFTLLTTGIIGMLVAPYLGTRFYQSHVLGLLAAIVVATTALTYFFPLTTIALQVARRIRALAVLETANKLLLALLPLALVLAGWGVWGIVNGQFLAMLLISIASAIIYLKLLKSETFFPSFKTILRERINWAKLRYYLRFSLEIAFSKNLVKFNSFIPLLLLGYFLPTNSGVGFFKIALAYMSLPLLLLEPVTRLLNVQLPFTRLHGEGRLRQRFWQVTFLSLVLSLLFTVPLLLFISPVIKYIFPEYEPSIKLVYGLAFYPALAGIGIGLGPMFRTLDRMKAAIVIQFTNLFLLVPGAYYFIKFYSIKGLIIVTLVFTLLPNLLSFIYLYFLKDYGRREEL